MDSAYEFSETLQEEFSKFIIIDPVIGQFPLC